GVVNFVLDKEYEGLKGNFQYGVSDEGDNETDKYSLVGGKSLFDGKLHVLGSYEYYDSKGVPKYSDRKYGGKNFCRLGSGTASDPFSLAGPGCTSAIATSGGLVAFPFAGMKFEPDGRLTPFDSGDAVGIDGDGTRIPDLLPLVSTLERESGFLRADFEFNDDTSGYIQSSYPKATNGPAYSGVEFSIGGTSSGITIFADNAFLHPDTSAAL